MIVLFMFILLVVIGLICLFYKRPDLAISACILAMLIAAAYGTVMFFARVIVPNAVSILSVMIMLLFIPAMFAISFFLKDCFRYKHGRLYFLYMRILTSHRLDELLTDCREICRHSATAAVLDGAIELRNETESTINWMHNNRIHDQEVEVLLRKISGLEQRLDMLRRENAVSAVQLAKNKN